MVASLPFTEEEHLFYRMLLPRLSLGSGSDLTILQNLASIRRLATLEMNSLRFILLCNSVASDNDGFISTSHPHVNPITDIFFQCTSSFNSTNEEET